MKLITETQRKTLLENGIANQKHMERDGNTIDFKPVVKLFNPCGNQTWLLSELDPDDTDIAFGLCDLGFGCPELGSVRLSELESVRGPFGIGIERDRSFAADKTLGEYAREASRLEYIRA